MKTKILIIAFFFVYLLLNGLPTYSQTKKVSKNPSITDANFDAKTAKGLVVVYPWLGWAPMAIRFDNEAKAVQDSLGEKISFFSFDYEIEKAILKRFTFNTNAYPFYVVYLDGKIVSSHLGYQNKKELSLAIAPYLITKTSGNPNCLTGDCINGYGVLKFNNGDRYEGVFKDSKFSGAGIYKYANGDIYQGQFVNGLCEGNGTLTRVNGTKKEGTWKAGVFFKYYRTDCISGNCGDGYGVAKISDLNFYSENNSYSTYEGYFVDGLYSGQGKYSFSNGDIYTGSFLNGKKHGKGTYYDKSSGVTKTGTWVNDKQTD
jgi:hypothetical protein